MKIRLSFINLLGSFVIYWFKGQGRHAAGVGREGGRCEPFFIHEDLCVMCLPYQARVSVEDEYNTLNIEGLFMHLEGNK